MIELTLDYLKINDVEYKENQSFRELSTVKIGDRARIVAYPNSGKKLVQLVQFLKNIKLQYKIVGRMSNVLPPDVKYDGVIIRTDRLCAVTVNDGTVTAEAGISLPRLVSLLPELSGLEELSGIPGSLGGAVIGNAGAFGREISQLLLDVSFYDLTEGRIRTESAASLGFSYRESIFKTSRAIVLGARLRLCPSDKSAVINKINEYRDLRKRTQPVGVPSLGSTFKRPGEGLYAARMIDACGLKGYKVGGAMISEKHAGFIVNAGGADAEDYLSVARYAEEQVLNRFGIRLEKEIEVMQ